MKTANIITLVCCMCLMHAAEPQEAGVDDLFCVNDGTPALLEGMWMCNASWLIDSSPELSDRDALDLLDGIAETSWFHPYDPSDPDATQSLVLKLPNFYVATGVRLRGEDLPGSGVQLLAWNDTTFDDYQPSVDHWFLVAEVPNIAGQSVELNGFSRLSEYWKIVVTSKQNSGDKGLPEIRDIAFQVKTGLSAMGDIVMRYVEPDPGAAPFTPNSDARAAPITNSCQSVRSPVPASIVRKYRLATWYYSKYTEAYGVPILTHGVVDSRALQRACYVVRFLLADRAAIRDAMYRNNGRIVIIGRRQTVPGVPEYRHLVGWTHRAAGGTFEIPVTVGAEENVLCEAGDSFGPPQDILMHEFAHGIHLIAARTADPSFNGRLQASFNAARRRGLWTNTYANTNNIEYFAEGVQAFYNQQRLGPVGGDGIQNNINTRQKLMRHDRNLYNHVREIFPCARLNFIHRCTDTNQGKGLAQQIPTNSCDGGGGGGGGGGCEDKKENCGYWKEQGHCTTGEWVDYMKENCPKSCDACPTTTTSPTTTTTITTTTCTDTKDNCQYWHGQGYCTSVQWSEYMEQYCPKSCDKCLITPPPLTTTLATTTTTNPITTTTAGPSSCEDTKENCQYWKDQGYCTSAQWSEYMEQYCPKSCDKCLITPPPLTTTLATTTTTTTTTPSTTTDGGGIRCQDKNDNCKAWAEAGYCTGQYEEYMTANCSDSCDKCLVEPPPLSTTSTNPTTTTTTTTTTAPTTTTTTTSSCVDDDARCPDWERSGYCNGPLGPCTSLVCKKSCNICTGILTPPGL